jgi:hypothetical protein
LVFSRSFFNPDVPHPTGLATALVGDSLQVYMVDEGRDAAVLLTSFAIPIPASATSAQPRPIADVFVLQGPGFSKALDIPSILETAGLQLPEGLGRLTEAEINALVIAPLLVGGGDAPPDNPREEQQGDDDLDLFVIGQQASLSGRRSVPASDAIDNPITSETVDRVFEQWIPAENDEFMSLAAELRGAGVTLEKTTSDAVVSPLRSYTGTSQPVSDPTFAEPTNGRPQAGASPSSQIADQIFSEPSVPMSSPACLQTHRDQGVLTELTIRPELPDRTGRDAADLPLPAESGKDGIGEVSRALAAALVMAELCRDRKSARVRTARGFRMLGSRFM